jgi:hypothetical protein
MNNIVLRRSENCSILLTLNSGNPSSPPSRILLDELVVERKLHEVIVNAPADSERRRIC